MAKKANTRRDASNVERSFNDARSSSSNGSGSGRGEKPTSSKSTGRQNKDDKRGSRRGNSRRNSADRSFADKGASPLKPQASSGYLVFPSASASVQRQHFITSPGQENFVNMWNSKANGDTSRGALTMKSGRMAKRTCSMMVLSVIPYFGSFIGTANYMSPIDTASLKLKQFIDTTFGTVTSYSAADLGAYLIGVTGVFSEIAELKRDLRLCMTYIEGQYPAFIPRGAFAALGISDADGNYEAGEGADYTALNLRNYVDRLNQLIIIFNRLPMPPELIYLFSYNDDLYDHVFMDTDDLRSAQLYAFRNRVTWQYNETLIDQGATVEPIPKARVNSISDRLLKLSLQIEALTPKRTQSVAMMTNLFNAYGSTNAIQVPLLSYEDLGSIDFVYDQHILTMIENATPLFTSDDDTGTAVVGNIQSVAATNELRGGVWAYNGAVEADNELAVDVPLQFHKPVEEITDEDIGWALRMHAHFGSLSTFTAHSALNPDGQLVYGLNCNNMCGFTFLDSFELYAMTDTNELATYTFSTMKISPTNTSWYVTLDFESAPIFKFYTYLLNEAHDATYSLSWYSAHRDAEFTYKYSDMVQFYTYLTMDVWAASITRPVKGTRSSS